MANTQREMQQLVELAEGQGWTVTRTTKGVMFKPPDKSRSQVLAHLTCSDHRARLNLVAALRRSGLVVPR